MLVYYEIHELYIEAARREKRFKNWPRQWKLGCVDNCSTILTRPTCRGLSAASMDPADKPRDVGSEMNCQQTLIKRWPMQNIIAQLMLNMT